MRSGASTSGSLHHLRSLRRKATLTSRIKPGRAKGGFTQARRFDRLKVALENHPAGLTLSEIAALLHVSERSARRYLDEINRVDETVQSVVSNSREPHRWRLKPQEQPKQISLRKAQAFLLLATRHLFLPLKGSASFDGIQLAFQALKQVADRPVRSRKRGELIAKEAFDERFLFAGTNKRSKSHFSETFDEVYRATAELRLIHALFELNVFTTLLNSAHAVQPSKYDRSIFFQIHKGSVRATLKPYALIVFDGEIFLVGAFVSAGEEELPFVFPATAFIEATSDEKDTFKLPHDFEVETYLHGQFGVALPKPSIRVVVEFDRLVAEDVLKTKIHPKQKIAKSRDGRIRVSFPVHKLDVCLSWILSYGDSAKVIEPAELVQNVMDQTRRLIAKYK